MKTARCNFILLRFEVTGLVAIVPIVIVAVFAIGF